MAKKSSGNPARAGANAAKRGGLMSHSPRHKDLKAQALERIRWKIFTGEFPPGSLVSALGIAKRLSEETGEKWSRSPVREALGDLANEGIIRWKGIAGAEVQVIDKNLLARCLLTRYGIETQAAQRLGRRPDPKEIAKLRGLIGEMEEVFEEANRTVDTLPTPQWDDVRWRWYELDKEFHLRIAEASGLWRAKEYIANLLDYFLLYATQNSGIDGDVCGEHREIVDAIEKFDRKNLQKSHQRVRAAVKAHMVGSAKRWAADIISEVEELE